MTFGLSAFWLSWVAACIWVGIRLINRRDQRTRQWGLILGAMPVVYVASFGPACWLSSRTGDPQHASVELVEELYQPCLRMGVSAPPPVSRMISFWATCLARREWSIRDSCFTDDCFWSN